MKAAIYNA